MEPMRFVSDKCTCLEEGLVRTLEREVGHKLYGKPFEEEQIVLRY